MGGGSLMTPILVIVFGFKPTLAVGTDILHGAIFKTVGAIRHRRLGTVHARLSGWMLVGSAPMSLLGVALGDAPEPRLRRRRELRDGLRPRRRAALRRVRPGREELRQAKVIGDDDRFDMVWRDRIAAVAIGLVRRLHRRPDLGRQRDVLRADDALRLPARAHKIVGTDILHAAALLYVAGFGHFIAGQRRLARRRLAPDRLDSRSADRQPLLGPAPGGAAAARARRRARDQRAEAGAGPERLPRRRDRRVRRPSGSSRSSTHAAVWRAQGKKRLVPAGET